jgi:glycosyltransferase involved in cell wall biosynthesis
VLQLVRICAPGPVASEVPFLKAYVAEDRPFLTALIRTRGRRIHTLRETLLCLNGQTDRDFEVLVVGHRLEANAIKDVERVLDDQPEDMRQRTRFIRVEDGNRVRPLNVGFAEARGRYTAILDDDDVPMGHWVETFRAMEHRAPGRVLRAACVRQSVRSVAVQNLDGLRAEGPPEACYAKTFDVIGHLRSNESPPICLAFPRGAFHDLGIRFDEMMTTTEDWDYLMRVALLVGVESSTACTGVYRWWTEGESSRTEHPQSEWHRNYDAIMRKLDSRPLLLPAGTAARLRQLHRPMAHRLAGDNGDPRTELDNLRAMVAGSLTLRLARAIPQPLRTFVRRLVRRLSCLKGN